MDPANHDHEDESVAPSKRRYIQLNDEFPPLETLVVAIEGFIDLAGVCSLSIPFAYWSTGHVSLR